mmetsp:Transcript_74926/g.219509  ORF Transcript_74926/g.219509 Transcript_74926/m.219509 type:complete len:446 (+) Transcript_74926:101-1438(+)
MMLGKQLCHRRADVLRGQLLPAKGRARRRRASQAPRLVPWRVDPDALARIPIRVLEEAVHDPREPGRLVLQLGAGLVEELLLFCREAVPGHDCLHHALVGHARDEVSCVIRVGRGARVEVVDALAEGAGTGLFDEREALRVVVPNGNLMHGVEELVRDNLRPTIRVRDAAVGQEVTDSVLLRERGRHALVGPSPLVAVGHLRMVGGVAARPGVDVRVAVEGRVPPLAVLTGVEAALTVRPDRQALGMPHHGLPQAWPPAVQLSQVLRHGGGRAEECGVGGSCGADHRHAVLVGGVVGICIHVLRVERVGGRTRTRGCRACRQLVALQRVISTKLEAADEEDTGLIVERRPDHHDIVRHGRAMSISGWRYHLTCARYQEQRGHNLAARSVMREIIASCEGVVVRKGTLPLGLTRLAMPEESSEQGHPQEPGHCARGGGQWLLRPGS